jgi:uncharacterized protein YutD
MTKFASSKLRAHHTNRSYDQEKTNTINQNINKPFPFTQLTTPYFILKHTTENKTKNHQKKKKKTKTKREGNIVFTF